MAAFFGLHVGSTSISIAVAKDKSAEVLANDAGDRVIPAHVSYNDGEKSVGVHSIRNSTNVITGCKRLLGYTNVDIEEVKLAQKRCPCKIVKLAKSNELGYEMKNSDGNIEETISVKKVLDLLFQHLMYTAVRHIGIRGESFAVLAVPMEFTEEQKQLISDAATSNGFKVLQVINEPSAAILACQTDENGKYSAKNRIAVVYRVGGTSLTVTVFSISNGHYRILGTVNRLHLGGEDVTDMLTEHLCVEFQRLYKIDIRSNQRSMYKLRMAAEDCKRILSSVTTTACSVESLYDGIDFLCNFSRARLEALLSNLISKFLESIEEVLATCQLTADKVDLISLCGGTCKIPRLQQDLCNYFSKAEMMHRQCPDEVLALGACYQAELFKKLEDYNVKEEFIVPAITNSLYYKIADGENKLIFEKGTVAPMEKHEIVQLNDNNCELHVMEIVEDGVNATQRKIAKMTMEDVPEKSVSVTFRANVNNTVDISVTSKDASKCFTIL